MVYDGARQSSELLECILQWARAQTGRLEVNPSVIRLPRSARALRLFSA